MKYFCAAMLMCASSAWSFGGDSFALGDERDYIHLQQTEGRPLSCALPAYKASHRPSRAPDALRASEHPAPPPFNKVHENLPISYETFAPLRRAQVRADLKAIEEAIQADPKPSIFSKEEWEAKRPAFENMRHLHKMYLDGTINPLLKVRMDVAVADRLNAKCGVQAGQAPAPSVAFGPYPGYNTNPERAFQLYIETVPPILVFGTRDALEAYLIKATRQEEWDRIKPKSVADFEKALKKDPLLLLKMQTKEFGLTRDHTSGATVSVWSKLLEEFPEKVVSKEDVDAHINNVMREFGAEITQLVDDPSANFGILLCLIAKVDGFEDIFGTYVLQKIVKQNEALRAADPYFSPKE